MEKDFIKCNHCYHIGVPIISRSGPHIKASCAKCSRYIKFMPANNPPGEFKLWFGKYRDKTLQQIANEIGGANYLQWLAFSDSYSNKKVKSKVRQFLDEINK